MLNMDTFEWSELGRDDLLPVGHQLNKPELLFEKIDKKWQESSTPLVVLGDDPLTGETFDAVLEE